MDRLRRRPMCHPTALGSPLLSMMNRTAKACITHRMTVTRLDFSKLRGTNRMPGILTREVLEVVQVVGFGIEVKFVRENQLLWRKNGSHGVNFHNNSENHGVTFDLT